MKFEEALDKIKKGYPCEWKQWTFYWYDGKHMIRASKKGKNVIKVENKSMEGTRGWKEIEK